VSAIQLLAHAVLWVAVGFAFRSICAFTSWWRGRKPSASPSRALGADRSGPYRALIDAGAPDHAQLALDLADDAVRRERERMNGIVRAVGERADSDAQRSIVKAVTDGINGGT